MGPALYKTRKPSWECGRLLSSPGDVVAPDVTGSAIVTPQDRILQREHAHFLDRENIDGSCVR